MRLLQTCVETKSERVIAAVTYDPQQLNGLLLAGFPHGAQSGDLDIYGTNPQERVQKAPFVPLGPTICVSVGVASADLKLRCHTRVPAYTNFFFCWVQNHFTFDVRAALFSRFAQEFTDIPTSYACQRQLLAMRDVWNRPYYKRFFETHRWSSTREAHRTDRRILQGSDPRKWYLFPLNRLNLTRTSATSRPNP